MKNDLSDKISDAETPDIEGFARGDVHVDIETLILSLENKGLVELVIKSLHNNLRDSNDKLASLNGEFVLQKEKLEKIQHQLNLALTTKQFQQSHMETLESENTSLLHDKEKLTEEVKSITGKLKAQLTHIQELSQELRSKTKATEDATVRLENLQQLLESKDSKQEDIQKELQCLKEYYKQQDQDFLEKKKELQSKINENEAMLVELERLDYENNSLLKEKEGLTEELQLMKARLEKQLRMINDLSDELASQTVKQESAKTEFESAGETFASELASANQGGCVLGLMPYLNDEDGNAQPNTIYIKDEIDGISYKVLHNGAVISDVIQSNALPDIQAITSHRGYTHQDSTQEEVESLKETLDSQDRELTQTKDNLHSADSEKTVDLTDYDDYPHTNLIIEELPDNHTSLLSPLSINTYDTPADLLIPPSFCRPPAKVKMEDLTPNKIKKLETQDWSKFDFRRRSSDDESSGYSSHNDVSPRVLKDAQSMPFHMPTPAFDVIQRQLSFGYESDHSSRLTTLDLDTGKARQASLQRQPVFSQSMDARDHLPLVSPIATPSTKDLRKNTQDILTSNGSSCEATTNILNDTLTRKPASIENTSDDSVLQTNVLSSERLRAQFELGIVESKGIAMKLESPINIGEPQEAPDFQTLQLTTRRASENNFFSLLRREGQFGALVKELNALTESDPALLQALDPSSGKTPLMTAVESGNIVGVRWLLSQAGTNLDHKNRSDKTIFTQYDPLELAQSFTKNSADASMNEQREHQLKCLECILHSTYEKERKKLQTLINDINATAPEFGLNEVITLEDKKKRALASAAKKVLDAADQIKESLKTPDKINTSREARKQADALIQCRELCDVLNATTVILEKNQINGVLFRKYTALTERISSGRRHIGKIVGGAMLSFLGVLGIIAGTGLILTGIGIPLAIPIKVASVAALSVGASTIAVGLGGGVGGVALSYRRREKGLKRAAGLFSNELRKQVQRSDKRTRTIESAETSGPRRDAAQPSFVTGFEGLSF